MTRTRSASRCSWLRPLRTCHVCTPGARWLRAVEALRGDLDQASEAIARARDLAIGEQRDRLVPRLEALEDAIDATRPIAEAAAYHLHCAGDVSADVDPARIGRPQQLEHRLATVDRRLERVDEDVRFLDLATGRATSAASRSTAAVTDPEGPEGTGETVAIDEISAAAHRRLSREQSAATSPSLASASFPTSAAPVRLVRSRPWPPRSPPLHPPPHRLPHRLRTTSAAAASRPLWPPLQPPAMTTRSISSSRPWSPTSCAPWCLRWPPTRPHRRCTARTRLPSSSTALAPQPCASSPSPRPPRDSAPLLRPSWAPDRHRTVTDARAVAMTAVRRSGLTHTAIADHCEKDHTSAIHAVRRTEDNPRLLSAATSIGDGISVRYD